MDVAIYETFARMSQPWINNIPEVDWHGANGSQVAGPECASSRYTEARLSKASEDGFFSNIKKNAVNMIPNFTEDDEWPEVLPAIFPRLYVNGSQGIGMTISNVWAPGNLNEFVNNVKNYLETGKVNCSNVYPDFPSGGIIINKKDLHTIYETGKGKIVLRATTEIVKDCIKITELPYQVYVEELIDNIKNLVVSGEIKGIDDIYNKSDKGKILIEIECSQDCANSILNKLFKLTDLEKTISPNQYALITKVPELLNLQKYTEVYVKHNIECILREYKFELEKAKARKEIVDGLIKATEDIDNIIALIKNSESTSKAKENLILHYWFTDRQAQAIIDMKLGRLAKLEKIELNKEAFELNDSINNLYEFINNENSQKVEFFNRLSNFAKKYGFERRTKLIDLDIEKEKKVENNIEPQKCVVILTKSGLIKRVPCENFKVQKRGSKGIKTQDDVTIDVIRTNTQDNLLILTNKGKLYRLLVDEVPEGTSSSKGVPVKGLINLSSEEEPMLIYSIYRGTDNDFILFVTKNGIVKKTELSEYVGTKKNGIETIKFKTEDDYIANISLIKDQDIIILSKNGTGIKFNSCDITPTGRITMGTVGIKLEADDKVVDVLTVREKTDDIAVFSKSGFCLRFANDIMTTSTKGKKGVKIYKDDEIVCGSMVNNNDNLLITTQTSNLCINMADVEPRIKYGNMGVRISKTGNVVSATKI